MKPTNEERRKIAAELREHRDPLTPYNLVDYIFEDPWNRNNGEEVADRLADLIDPTDETCEAELTFETCEAELTDVLKVHETVREYECSKCGMSWETVWAYDYGYCPYCGRLIVNADE